MGLNKRSLFVLATSLAMAGSIPAIAQPAPGDGGGPGGRRQGGGGGQWDPAQMRERMEQMLKEQLGVTEEEWSVLKPKIEAVQTAQRDAGGGMAGMFGGRGRGGPGGPGGMMGDQGPSPVQSAQRELREVLQDKGASADSVKAKVDALRKARAEAKEKLTKAQGELKELLTPRQEAVFVMMGWLE